MSTTQLAQPTAAPAPAVTADSYLTLHYRLAARDGTEIISTFNGNPATLQLGMGQLAGPLEACLAGLGEGTRHVFELPPEQAFGPRNPALLQHVSMAMLRENSNLNEDYAIGDLVEFNAPSGGKFAGVLRRIDDTAGLFDFNHPLAGQDVIFEVQIISIL